MFGRKSSLSTTVELAEIYTGPVFYLHRLPEIKFSEDDDEPEITIPAFQLGETVHDNFGVPHPVTVGFAEKLKENFDNKVRGIDILTDWEHGTDVSKGKAASGKIVGMTIDKTKNQMLYTIKLTKEAVKDLKERRYRYFSPSWLPTWKHNSTGEEFELVPNGGGFTNRPIQKTIPAINFAETLLDPEVDFDFVEADGETTLEARPDEREPGTYGNPDTEDPRHQRNEQSAGEPPAPNVDLDTEVPNQSAEKDEGGEFTLDPKVLREKLGLPEDATDEEVLAKVEENNKAAVAFSEHQARVEKSVAFAEAYPDEHDWIQKKKEEERQSRAVEFAESFRITHDGRTFVPTQQAQDKLKETHLKFTSGEVAFAEVQDAIQEAVSGELVELGERGTKNGENDGRDDIAGMSYEQAGVQFAEFATEEILAAKKENEEIDFNEGLKRAATKHPEVAKKYYESIETGV